MRNRTSDLRIPRSDALPLSHRESTVSENDIDDPSRAQDVCHMNFVKDFAHRKVPVPQW